MSPYRQFFIRQMWTCLPFIIGVTGASANCFAQAELAKSLEQETKRVDGLRHAEARTTLEATRRELESQYAKGEEEAMKAAREYRDEAARKPLRAKKVAELKTALNAAVNASFNNQLMLQKTRLQIAELDLEELKAKYARRESLGGSIVERRIADLMSGEDLGWSTSTKATRHDTTDETTSKQKRLDNEPVPSIPIFATPQELLEYLEKTTIEDLDIDKTPSKADTTRKLRTLFAVIDDDEINRFAGFCLRTGSMLRSASKVAEGFSALAPDGANDEIIRVGRKLNTLIQDARLRKPPRAAQSAYEEICASEFSFLQLMFSSGSGTAQAPTIDADAYSAKLRKAAGVLKDPRRFVMDFMELMTEFASNEKEEKSNRPAVWKPTQWQVTIDGDKAIAVDSDEGESSLELLNSIHRFEMVKVGDTWKISNMIPDQEIVELQQGMKTKSSSDSDKPDPPTKELPDLPLKP